MLIPAAARTAGDQPCEQVPPRRRARRAARHLDLLGGDKISLADQCRVRRLILLPAR